VVGFGLNGKPSRGPAQVIAAESELARDRMAFAAMRWAAFDWRRLVPETLALTAIVFLVDRVFTLGDASASTLPQTLWIPVGLISVQYGLAGGVFASFCATVALYAPSMPPQSANQDFYAYAGSLLAQPAAWLACALSLGGLRNLHMAHAAGLSDDLAEARQTAETLQSGLSRTLIEIDRLERRIAGETSTVAAIVRALAGLDSRNVNTLAVSFAPVVRDGAGVATGTLYLETPSGIEAVARIVDGEAATLAEAPRLPETLIKAMREGRGTVRRAEPDASNLLPGTAQSATPIVADRGNVLFGVIVIERLRPGQDPDRAASRAELLGLALGNILRPMNSRFRLYHVDSHREMGG
jgi:hypothetical protein